MELLITFDCSGHVGSHPPWHPSCEAAGKEEDLGPMYDTTHLSSSLGYTNTLRHKEAIEK